MLAKSIILAATAALVAAIPVSQTTDCNGPHPDPTLPSTGTGTQLPAPDSGLKLKRIALGLGIQNYTCAAVGGTATAAGALAMLYDITSLYPGQSRYSLSQEDFNGLAQKALNTHEIPLNFNSSTEGRVEPSALGASLTNPFTEDAPLRLGGSTTLPFTGHHFFNDQGVPTFVLTGNIQLLSSKKATVPAPADADKGPMGTGAVAWLNLVAVDGSFGAKSVYRVLTAGGNSHGCSKAAGADSTSYAATYWFYD